MAFGTPGQSPDMKLNIPANTNLDGGADMIDPAMVDDEMKKVTQKLDQIKI
ncbi:MAG: hypothetical protein HOO67_03840 [Candidatus Peribacteraceae bacterium]|nr:hypothetical protein [Candidatus Peribacteraceae bacterium]